MCRGRAPAEPEDEGSGCANMPHRASRLMASETGTASPVHACKHAQAGFSPASGFHRLHVPTQPHGPEKLCCNGCVEKAYEFRQSTTMFFHRFLVPTIVMMHFLLGLI